MGSRSVGLARSSARLAGPATVLTAAFLALLLLAPAASPLGPRAAHADEVFVVDTFIDALPAVAAHCTPVPVANSCSLRDAVAAANAAGPGTHTINLPAGVHTLTEGQLVITNSAGTVRIAGATLDPSDTTTMRDAGSPAFRIFLVSTDANLELHAITVSGGNDATVAGGGGISNFGTLTIVNSAITGNTAVLRGGGIRNSADRTVEITDSIISSNTVGGSGGGLNNEGLLSIANSVITGNSATNSGSAGGGINNTETMALSNSVISYNTSAATGGGIHSSSAITNISNSMIIGNTSANGAGINSASAGNVTTLTNSTISGNTASSNGGGIENTFGATNIINSTISDNEATGVTSNGGGIRNSNGGTVNLTNSTVSGNTSVNGGGISDSLSTVLVTNTTITDNAATSGGGIRKASTGTLTLHNSIVAVQQSGSDCSSGGGTFTADAFNLDSDGTCDASTTQADAGDFLGPLADNGGPTLTHALLSGSAAINAGDNTICAQTFEDDGSGPNDQRGPAFVRSFGASCDIGAFELQPVGKLRLTKALQPSSDAGRFGFEIDGVLQPPVGVGDGGGTGQEIVPAGSRTVEETLVSGAPSLAHYFTAISCAASDGAGAPVATGTGPSLSIPVAEGAEVACVFTNTRVPEQCLGMTFDRAVVGAGSIYGTAQRDLLIGSDGSNLIVGGAGDDCIDGGGGNDILRGDAGNDVVLGGAGVDNIQGGAGNDELHGGPGNDVIVGNEGNDSLYGDLGSAGAGQVDQLDGSAGTDLCKGTIRVRCEH